MTWNELVKQIMQMPEAERKKPARYVGETCGDNPEEYPVIEIGLQQADENINNDIDGEVSIPRHGFFLQ